MFLKCLGVLIITLFSFELISCSSGGARVSTVNKKAAADTLQFSSSIDGNETEDEEDSIVEVHLDKNGDVEYVSTNFDRFDSLLNVGKSEFGKAFDSQNYALAVKNLEEAVRLKPDNAEARYFLGYAYSRLSAKDGKTLNKTSAELTIKSSEQLEKVIKLSPRYTGELVALDPYSKITAEWGSLAMSYLYDKKYDSTLWAFNEGKKRGGFGTFFLSVNRMVLDNCPQNTILISNGDNYTIPLWYLQFMEKYRPDVTVVDINLLNTIWYPRYLKANAGIFSSVSNGKMDAIGKRPWKDSLITIPCPDKRSFSWIAKAYDGETHFYRGDLLFLRLITENKFNRNIYFTAGFPEYARLNLSDNLKKNIIVDKLNFDNSPQPDSNSINSLLANISSCFTHINENSQLESKMPDQLRYEVLDLISRYMKANRKNDALNVLQTLNSVIDVKRYPFNDSRFQIYIESLLRELTE